MNAFNKLFSIVTVVYNSEDLLEETIKSVINQDSADFEYVIIDGGSTDGTLDIIKKYKNSIAAWISEPDKGIWDAMNKSIDYTKGEFILFMNSGDTFYSKKILSTMAKKIREIPYGEIFYGKVIKKTEAKEAFYFEKGRPLSKKDFFLSIPICHQTMFTKRELFDEIGPYSLGIKQAQLHDWLAKYYNVRTNLDSIIFIDLRIAVYLLGGNSAKYKQTIEIERLSIAWQYYDFPYQFLYFIRFCIEYIKTLVMGPMVRLGLMDVYRKVKYGTITTST